MKKYLLKTSVLLLIIAAMAMGVEMIVRSWQNSYKLKYQWMESNADSVEHLILGNSHAFYGLCPDEIDGTAFNLSNVSQTLDYDVDLLERYLPRMKVLKTVTINYDNSNAFDPSADETEPYRSTFYALYMHIWHFTPLSTRSLELANPATLRAKITKHWQGNDLEVDSLGWGNTYKQELRDPENISQDKAQLRMKGHTCHDWQQAVVNRQLLFRIAKLCQQHGIQLVILQTPVSHSYAKHIPRHQQAFIDATIEQCQQQYNATCIDWRQEKNFTDSDFFDTDHLTDSGAKKLSRAFNAIVN